MQGPTVPGTVIELLPDLFFRVELQDGSQIIAYSSGKMRHNKIKVILGDHVAVVLDPYKGKTTNRIVRRT